MQMFGKQKLADMESNREVQVHATFAEIRHLYSFKAILEIKLLFKEIYYLKQRHN